jgi:DNA primase
MDAVEEVKARLPIEDVVGRYVDLRRSGASLKGLCPFHQEKTPSFYVSPQRGTYHCFGCGQGGDAFTFVMEMEHLAFPDALKRLAEQAGVSLPERQEGRPSLKNRLFEANAAAARFFTEMLRADAGNRARHYLFERGFGEDANALFDLGYAPREGLVTALRQQGFDDRVILAAGLGMEDERTRGLRDRFHHRLMFPIRDASGRISGFGGRVLGEGQPKYLNSPQTEVFDKSAVLFGIHRAQDAIRQSGRAVLVEGYLDAVRAHLAGYPATVASLGTAVTAQQLATLARMTETVIAALDPDPAGQAAAARTSLTALMEVTRARGRSAGAAGAVDLRIARLPEGEGDPDDLIQNHPVLWERALEESTPAFEFYFTQVMDSLDRSTQAWRQEAVDRLLPLIREFSSSAGWQAIWVERLAAETGIDARALQRSIPGGQSPRRRTRREPGGSDVVARTTARALSSDPTVEVEEALLALLLQVLVIPREAAEALAEVALSNPDHSRILEKLLLWQNYDYDLFRDSLDDDLRSIADDLRGRSVPLPPHGKVSVGVKLHLGRRRQARLQSDLTRAMQMLQAMPVEEQAAAAENITAMLAEKREVDAEIARLQGLAPRLTHDHHA